MTKTDVKLSEVTCYTQEKSAGRNCGNFKCLFYDATNTYIQRCKAGDNDGNPFLPYCDKYIPEKKVS